jgi:hypothetical protein
MPFVRPAGGVVGLSEAPFAPTASGGHGAQERSGDATACGARVSARPLTAPSAVAVPYRPVHIQFAIRCRYHRSLRGPATAVRNIRARQGRRRHVPDAVRCRSRRRNVAVTGARPDRDSYPPWLATEHVRPAMRPHLATAISPKRNSLPSRHMPCSNTASLRATATTALRPPIRSVSARPQPCSRQRRVERRSRTLAASNR